MMGVKSIIFEINDHFLIVNFGDECEILYNNILIKIDKDKAFLYLESLLRIIDGWEKEYIDTKIIDGDNWKLSIIYVNGKKIEYYGRASFPYNFEEVERLNVRLMGEVLNE